MTDQHTKPERDALFDNIKAVMLFLVALGHVLDIGKRDDAVMMVLMKYIYLFHMPMFAFVTGYFSKNLEKARRRAVSNVLVPYLLMQTVYVIMAVVLVTAGLASFNADSFRPSVILPSSAFYYLLAVFFWKLLAADIMRLRFPLVTAVVLGVVFSLIPYGEFHEAYGAVFTLLCFFVAGVGCTEEMIRKIRRIPKAVGLLVMAAGILPAVVLPYSIHSVRMTYGDCGFGPWEGMMYRLAFYAIAAVMCMAVINLMPAKKCFLSQIGVSSVVVYGASTFLSPHGFVLAEKFITLPAVPGVRLAAMILFSALLVWISGLPVFLKIFNAIVAFCNKLLFRKSPEV